MMIAIDGFYILLLKYNLVTEKWIIKCMTINEYYLIFK